jgi:hypothetical protein
MTATQVKHPWRATVRTVFQGAVSACAAAPLIYDAATHGSAGQATGGAAVGLAVAAGITRVMALPTVEGWLARFVPFLAAQPAPSQTAATPPTGGTS